LQSVINPEPDQGRAWTRLLARYREPNHARSAIEIIITLLPFAGLWLLSWAAVHFGYWELSLLLAVPGAAFLVRLFMIQHDCGHGSFFRNRQVNDGVGRVIGVLTLTPYDAWRRAHASHHATSGHLDRRGIGDIDTLTVREFNALSPWGRLRYRAYRHRPAYVDEACCRSDGYEAYHYTDTEAHGRWFFTANRIV
jgi:omega-6 fatty acid desaturase (delta-12 desaturase)